MCKSFLISSPRQPSEGKVLSFEGWFPEEKREKQTLRLRGRKEGKFCSKQEKKESDKSVNVTKKKNPHLYIFGGTFKGDLMREHQSVSMRRSDSRWK